MIKENKMLTFNRMCPICGNHHSIVVDKDEYIKGSKLYRSGLKIQDAFPRFTPSQREFLLTGICDSCWDKI